MYMYADFVHKFWVFFYSVFTIRLNSTTPQYTRKTYRKLSLGGSSISVISWSVPETVG